MTWDFQTEPEFQEQLDWTARFVREEIWPIEPIADELEQAALEYATGNHESSPPQLTSNEKENL
jgi:hypothetical protein